MTTPRLLLDISTLLRHWERADGITRTLSKLAAYALDHIPQIEFVYLGGPLPLLVKTEHVRLFLAGKSRIDTSYFRDPSAKLRIRDSLPSVFKSAILWIQRPRRQALILLDHGAFEGSYFGQVASCLRQRLLNEKYRSALTAPDGVHVRLVPHDLALSSMKPLTQDDILIMAGSDWRLITDTLQRLTPKPRTTALCYDTIPLLFPAFFSEGNVAAFREFVENVLTRCDLVIFSAKQIAFDTETYLISRGLPIPPIATVALGADISPPARRGGSLPGGLTPRRFAMFVSTIEPRKNHRLLFEVWKTLLDEGVPQQSGFKLVFVGRRGWMVDDLWHDMTSHQCFGTSLLILADVDDATLASLYNACAFTLYPSFYEGFGLPIVESFRYGKAVISSSAGALSQTVAEFSPCISPDDKASWHKTIKQWMTDPTSYNEFERNIGLHYAPRSWEAAAGDFFKIVTHKLAPSLAHRPAHQILSANE